MALFIMLNALVHIGASLYLGEWVPGVMNSPILFMAALMLIVTTRRTGNSASAA